MKRSTLLLLAVAPTLALAFAACSASSGKNNSFETGGTEGTGGDPSGGSPSGTESGTGDTGAGGVDFTTGAGNGSGGPTCGNDPAIDGDMDGWTGADGDCNDCDPNTNPGAVEVVGVTDADGGVITADEDCDMEVDEIEGECDAALALDDPDPLSGAKAIELCQQTTPNEPQWGVLSAAYVRANGAAANLTKEKGILDGFGPNVNAQAGSKLLVLSSGNARIPGQPDACGQTSCTTPGLGTAPPGFPQDVPGCQGATEINDDVGLEVSLRAPTNATGYTFLFKFHSFEFPEWVCTSYNDQFIALVNPPPMGSISGNISFDSNNNPVSVNIAFFDVCDPAGIGNFASLCFMGCPAPPNPYCPSGTAELEGTGFLEWSDAGATSWLQTSAPIGPGEEFSIRFAIWDTGDSALDSTVLVDSFQWVANGGTVSVGTDPVPDPR